MRAPALVFAAVLLLPCVALAGGAPAAYPCAARGGAEWREHRSAHFVVATDLPTPRAAAVVRELELLHGLVLQAIVGEQVDIPGKVRVVVFADPQAFRRVAQSDVRGFFATDSLERPTIAFSMEAQESDPELIAHELAHHVSWHLFPRQPRWFAEGLAQFVQTVARPRERVAAAVGTHIVRGGGEVGGRWAGLAPAGLTRFLREEGGGVPEDLLAWQGPKRGDHLADHYYAWSWLLYHWMWNARSKAFVDFTTRLSNAEAPAAAWAAAFPDLDPAKPEGRRALSEALERYQRTGRYTSYEVRAPVDALADVVPLPPAEVHAIVYDVRVAATGDRQAAGVELEEAAREDPTQPSAAGWIARRDDRAAALRKVTVARPGDWRAWLLLALALPDAERAEREAALRKAVALEPSSALARNDLAWLLHESGRAREALAHANAAVDHAPGSAACLDTLAAVAAALGKCREAGVLQRRAIDLVRSDETRKGYEARLGELEARCAAAVPAPAAPRAP